MRYSEKTIFLMIGFVVVMLGLSSAAAATSLFQTESSLFADQKARHVGDLVTVIVTEQAQASQSANTGSSKGSNTSIGPGLGALGDMFPLFGFTNRDEFNASGSTVRSGSLSATLTTRVVDVYPNGTMKIEGKQTIVLNEEEQEIIVTGIIRGRDVTRQNTVLSTMVADAEIEFSGTGVVGDRQKPGLLTQLFNWLF